MGKNLLFYAVAGTVIGAVLGWAGAGIGLSLFASVVGPPALLLLWGIAKYKGLV